jgi:hypothetical protein
VDALNPALFHEEDLAGVYDSDTGRQRGIPDARHVAFMVKKIAAVGAVERVTYLVVAAVDHRPTAEDLVRQFAARISDAAEQETDQKRKATLQAVGYGLAGEDRGIAVTAVPKYLERAMPLCLAIRSHVARCRSTGGALGAGPAPGWRRPPRPRRRSPASGVSLIGISLMP